MKLMFVYKLLPAFVFFTDNIPEGFGGMANGPVVRIRKKYENTDEGILQHELTHVKQWYRTLGTLGLWYTFIESYRLKSEVECYKVQASYYNYDAIPWMADAIYTKYNIKSVTKQQVIDMLRSK
jgi:hypothetical protein